MTSMRRKIKTVDLLSSLYFYASLVLLTAREAHMQYIHVRVALALRCARHDPCHHDTTKPAAGRTAWWGQRKYGKEASSLNHKELTP